MIASLRGVLLERMEGRVVIEAGGVGYELLVSLLTAAALPSVGSEVSLRVYTHAVKDGGLQLFGFESARERAAFELLISVQGIGPKLALQILSGLPLSQLASAIARAEVGRLCAIRGVGKKTAERLVMELKDKVSHLAGPDDNSSPCKARRVDGSSERTAQALMALGYKTALAEHAALAASESLPGGSLEALLREALRLAEGIR